MDLRDSLNAFYYSNALCDLQLMNRQFTNPAITYNSLLYLEIIYSMQGKCTASRLADLLCVSRPGVTKKLNELLEQGLILKTPDPSDGRKYFHMQVQFHTSLQDLLLQYSLQHILQRMQLNGLPL